MTWKKYFTWNTKKSFNLLLVSAEEGGVRKKVVHRDAFQLKTYITNVSADEGGPTAGRRARRAREQGPRRRHLGRGQADAGRTTIVSRYVVIRLCVTE